MPITIGMGATLSESVATLLSFALLPIAKVFVMCALGLLMATSYIGILMAPARKQLTKLVFSLFLPCIIFTQLGKVVTLEKILQWWFIPVNVVLASVVGCTIGYMVALIVKPPPRFFNFTVVTIKIGNIGNIPLVIIGAICRDTSNPFGSLEQCNNDGVAYISFGQWVDHAVIVYTFVYQMLAPPEPRLGDVEAMNGDGPSKKPIANGTEYHGVYSSIPILEGDGGLIPLLENGKKKLYYEVSDWVTSCLGSFSVQDILQPPVVASFLALLIGVTPFLRSLVFEERSIFFFLSDSLNIMGGAMIPYIMLALGGNLVMGVGSSELGLCTTIAITAMRLLVIPVGGMAIVTVANKLGFLPPDDKMNIPLCLAVTTYNAQLYSSMTMTMTPGAYRRHDRRLPSPMRNNVMQDVLGPKSIDLHEGEHAWICVLVQEWQGTTAMVDEKILYELYVLLYRCLFKFLMAWLMNGGLKSKSLLHVFKKPHHTTH